MKRKITAVLLLLSLLLLSGCGKTVSSETIEAEESSNLVFGASESHETYSVSSSGIMYGSGNLIRYCDLETGESYILCDKSNCTHSSENCSAWYENELSAYGIALYQGTVCYLRWVSSSNEYQLITMDLTGNNQRTVATIDGGNYEIGTWHISTVEDVYYRSGYAWIGLTYAYPESETESIECTQWISVDLSSGAVTELNELTTDGTEYSVKAIAENVIVLCKRTSSLEELSEEDFYEAYERGEFGTDLQDAEDPYYEYQMKWYPANNSLTDVLICHNISTGEETVLEEAPVSVSFEEDGYLLGTSPKYIFLGDYEGLFLCEEMGSEETDRYFFWDPESGVQEEFLTISDDGSADDGGGTLAWENGSVYNVLYDGYGLLYCEYKENEMADIYLLNLETMDTKKLMEDKHSISFRIVGESDNYLIGKVYDDFGSTLYKISKEDYLNGDLSKKVKLRM